MRIDLAKLDMRSGLELVDLASFPPAAAAFVGALLAGILASLIKNQAGYPRISLTAS